MYVDPVEAAKGKSEEYAIKAIDYYLLASSFAPDNIVILQKISDVAKFYDKTQWSAKVHAKVYAFQLLRAKTNALGQLPKLKQELQTAQSELAKLQTQSGFFVGIRINDAQSRITRLRADIAKLEKDAAYDPLKVGK